MDSLGIKKISSQEQYLLFGILFSKRMDSDKNTCLYFPTLEMAKDVYITLQYFLWNWNRGVDGGKLESGISWYQEEFGVIPRGAIETILFSKINDEQLLSNKGCMLNINHFVEMSRQLMNHVCNLRSKTIPKYFYDEHFLTVLRYTGFYPRIKRTKFTCNLFAHDYIESDEETVRQMGLVLSETPKHPQNDDLGVLCNVDDDQVRTGGLTMLVTLGATELSSSVDLNGNLGDSDVTIKHVHWLPDQNLIGST